MAFHLIFDRDRCKGCGLCIGLCPKHILALDSAANEKGYSPASCTDEGACVGCATCAKICPDSVISIYKD